MRRINFCWVYFFFVLWASVPQTVAGELSITPLVTDALLLGGDTHQGQSCVVGEAGQMICTDGVETSHISLPTDVTLTAITFVNAGTGFAVGYDATVMQTDDGGEIWRVVYQDIEADTPLFDIAFVDSQTGFAVGAYGLMLATQDGGATWQQVAVAPDEEPHLYDVLITPQGVFLFGEFGTILFSADKGETWANQASGLDRSLFGGIGKPDGTVLAFGLGGVLLQSSDGPDAKVWSQIESPVTESLITGLAQPDGTLIIGGLKGRLLMIRDDEISSYYLPDRQDISGITVMGNKLMIFGPEGLIQTYIPSERL